MKTNEIKLLTMNNLKGADSTLVTLPDQTPFGASTSTVCHLKKRIQKILAALLEETWLPITLRSYMADEVTELNGMLKGEDLSDSSTITKEVHSISFMLSMYGNTHPKSELIAQVRMLDQELNASEYLRITSDQRRAS